MTDSTKLVKVVNDAYSAKAREGVDPKCKISQRVISSFCLTFFRRVDANKVAAAFGYTAEQLDSIPEGAHMGLSCGNPVASATIREASILCLPTLYINVMIKIGRNDCRFGLRWRRRCLPRC